MHTRIAFLTVVLGVGARLLGISGCGGPGPVWAYALDAAGREN